MLVLTTLINTKKITMKYLIIIFITTITLSAILLSCNKEKTDLIAENNKWVYVDSTKSANVRIIHCMAANAPSLPTASATAGPQVFVYANGQKLNGNALSYFGQWPSPNVYALIPSGTNVRFDIVMARLNLAVVPNVPAPVAGDTLFSFNGSLSNGKFYSLYLGDSAASFRGQLVEDVLTLPEYQKYKIRLVNYTMNPLDTFVVYSRKQGVNIIQDVTHKQISNWSEFDLPITVDTLDLRRKNSTVNITTFPFLPTGLRMYSLIARGKNLLTGKLTASSIVTNR
jgi:hypothetical protein